MRYAKVYISLEFLTEMAKVTTSPSFMVVDNPLPADARIVEFVTRPSHPLPGLTTIICVVESESFADVDTDDIDALPVLPLTTFRRVEG